MLHIEKGVYSVDVDVNATHKAYRKLPELSCDCVGCRNYLQAVDRAPEELKAFLTELGMDIRKPEEMATYAKESGGQELVQYGGTFYLVGELAQDVPEISSDSPDFVFHEGEATLFFHQGVQAKEKGFPKPTLRLEVFFWLPWELEAELKEEA